MRGGGCCLIRRRPVSCPAERMGDLRHGRVSGFFSISILFSWLSATVQPQQSFTGSDNKTVTLCTWNVA